MEEDLDRNLLTACGIDDLDELAARCQAIRRELGKPSARWTGWCLAAALRLAVTARGWPAGSVLAALLVVAADPATRGPMRLAEAGPWWDTAEHTTRTATAEADRDQLAELEAQLDAQDGRRVLLQGTAREQLSAEGKPLTRLAVARRAVRLVSDASAVRGRD